MPGDDLSEGEYAFMRDLLFRESGLHLEGDKRYLLNTRLTPVAATCGVGSVRALVGVLRDEAVRQLKVTGLESFAARGILPRRAGPVTNAVCDAMTTNETLFFRDGHPFDVLRDAILPAAARRREKEAGTTRAVRVWCAAASTGQEPYSVSMCALLAESRMAGLPVEILATDYSATALRRAREGVYSEFEIRRGLTPELVARFFTPVAPASRSTAGGTLRVNEAVRRQVRFVEHNLLDPPVAHAAFDVALCRNVLLYFDAPTRRLMLERVAATLAPGGVLLLGGTEMPAGIGDLLVRATDLPTPAYRRVQNG